MLGGTFGTGNWNDTFGAGSSQEASDARNEARRNQMEIRFLRTNMEKTLLICEALWELLRERGKMTDEDLNNKLYEIDMRDGVLDGKNQRKVAECPKCKRKNSPRHAACLYCGHIIDDSVFSMSQ